MRGGYLLLDLMQIYNRLKSPVSKQQDDTSRHDRCYSGSDRNLFVVDYKDNANHTVGIIQRDYRNHIKKVFSSKLHGIA